MNKANRRKIERMLEQGRMPHEEIGRPNGLSARSRSSRSTTSPTGGKPGKAE